MGSVIEAAMCIRRCEMSRLLDEREQGKRTRIGDGWRVWTEPGRHPSADTCCPREGACVAGATLASVRARVVLIGGLGHAERSPPTRAARGWDRSLRVQKRWLSARILASSRTRGLTGARDQSSSRARGIRRPASRRFATAHGRRRRETRYRGGSASRSEAGPAHDRPSAASRSDRRGGRLRRPSTTAAPPNPPVTPPEVPPRYGCSTGE